MQLAQKVLSTRGGTIAVGGLAALMACVVLLFYLSSYRSSVNESGEMVTVLVAKNLIEKGTPGDVVGLQELFQTNEAPKSQLRDGVVTDPSTLRGRVAVVDIYPGQQLTTADFSTARTNALGTKIAGSQRAISIPLDSAHGMIGQVEAGDRVDVIAGFNVERITRSGAPAGQGGQARPVMRVIMQNIFVVEAPAKAKTTPGAGGQSNVVLRVGAEQAAELAFAAENGKIWIVLRPRAGAQPTKPHLVTAETLLFGVKPIAALKSFGGRR
jgi:Flp pilus assembly protein CpaB